MCGITGYITNQHQTDAVLEALQAMGTVQKHRGPDDAGIMVERNGEWHIGLGHQRLAILDLSSKAHQPMNSVCGRYVLVYNGEVYNYRELAETLGDDPNLRISTGDTAVVLAALIRWGTKALQQFNGMWALLLYDRQCKRVLIARDRFGIKPLYWYRGGHTILFASEIKALLAGLNQRVPLNYEIVARYLMQALTDGQEETFFQGIQAIPPASYAALDLTANEESLNLSFKRYWHHPVELGMPLLDNVDLEASVREVFLDAVRIRLRSDVPAGILLSGGIDSSAILGAALSTKDVKDIAVLSVVSRDPSTDESPYIDAMCRHVGCEAIKVVIDDSPMVLLDSLSDACWYNDQPLGGLSAVAHRELIRQAKQAGITVLLTGQGSDEQLAGYNKFFYFYVLDCLRRGAIVHALSTVAWVLWQGTILREFTWQEAKRYMPMKWSDRFAAHLSSRIRRQMLLSTNLGRSFRQREWQDLRYYSVPMLLHYEDRMSMSYSTEMRVPFLDVRLVELFGRIAPHYKLAHGWTKAIFRKAMKGVIPDVIRWRRDKRGFTIPEQQWAKDAYVPTFSAMFDRPMLAEDFGVIDRKGVKELYARFVKGDVRVSYKEVFGIYCLETWLRRFEPYLSAL